MSRLVFLLGCLLFCGALEFPAFYAQQVEAGLGADLQDRYRLGYWGVYVLIGAIWIALFALLPFR